MSGTILCCLDRREGLSKIEEPMEDKICHTTEAERRYRRKYYLQNREKLKERNRQYRKTHKEQIAAYQKQYSMMHDRSEYFRERWKKKKQEVNHGEKTG